MIGRIQLSRASGFNLQRASRALNGLPAIKIDRTTRYGNPWRIGEPVDMAMARRWGWEISPKGRLYVCRDATDAAARFRHALVWDDALHDFIRRTFAASNVACWCAPGAPCHGEPIIAVAASTEAEIAAHHEAADQRLQELAAQLGERA